MKNKRLVGIINLNEINPKTKIATINKAVESLGLSAKGFINKKKGLNLLLIFSFYDPKKTQEQITKEQLNNLKKEVE